MNDVGTAPKDFVCCPSHCCAIHGCKYGYRNCPVSIGNVIQEYLCESCYNALEAWEDRKHEYKAIQAAAIRVRELQSSMTYFANKALSSTGIGHLPLK